MNISNEDLRQWLNGLADLFTSAANGNELYGISNEQADVIREAARRLEDAERYAFLKSQYTAADFDYDDMGGVVLIFTMPSDARISANLDATIDAARGKK